MTTADAVYVAETGKWYIRKGNYFVVASHLTTNGR